TALSSDCGSLPLHLYKPLPGGGRERVAGHPLSIALNDVANPEMSAAAARSAVVLNALVHGDGYAEIERDQVGRVKDLWPLPSSAVAPQRTPDGRLVYVVTQPDGGQVTLSPRDMVHVRFTSLDGVRGRGLVEDGRDALSLLIAVEQFAGSFFSNGAAISGVLKHPKVLGAEGQKTLRQSIDASHRGVGNAHRFLILEEGMEYQRTGAAPEEAEMNDLRLFQVAEVSRLTGVPLSRLSSPGDVNRATAREESGAYHTFTLRPMLVAIEQELTFKCLSSGDRTAGFFVEHLPDAILRSDPKERAEVYATALSSGWMSPNEVRQLENRPPIADGDTP